MIQRLLAAVVGLLLVVPALLFGGVHAVVAIVAVVTVIGLDEWVRMALPGRPRGFFLLLGTVGLLVLSVLAYGPPSLHLAAVALGSLVLLLGALFGVRDTSEAAGVAARLVTGLVYVPVLVSFIIAVRRFDDGVAWVFLILAATWLGDTGAYFAGRALGKRKLFERISPKKTVEGALGGLVAAVAAGALVKAIGLPDVPWHHALVVAALIDISGVVGDLTESMFKRAFGVKDSGTIMPGHGGILDRIDSLLFSAPVAWVYWTVVAGT